MNKEESNNFRDAIKFIKTESRLTLKLSEKLELREYVKRTANKNVHHRGVEAALIFLNKNYNFNINSWGEYDSWWIKNKRKMNSIGYNSYH